MDENKTTEELDEITGVEESEETEITKTEENDTEEENINEEIKESLPEIKGLKPFLFITLIFGLAAAALETCVMLFGFDSNKGVYSAGGSLGAVAATVIAAFTVILIIASRFVKGVGGHAELAVCDGGTVSSFLAGICGGILPIYSLFSIVVQILSAKTGAYEPSVAERAAVALKTSTGTIALIILALSIPSAIYLLRTALKSQGEEKKQAALGFFPILWLSLSLVKQYFDRTTALNNPARIYAQMALVALMLYFLMEERVRVKKPLFKCYILSSAVAALVGFSFSVSAIVAAQFGITGLGIDPMLPYVTLFLSLYSFFKTAGLKK